MVDYNLYGKSPRLRQRYFERVGPLRRYFRPSALPAALLDSRGHVCEGPLAYKPSIEGHSAGGQRGLLLLHAAKQWYPNPAFLRWQRL